MSDIPAAAWIRSVTPVSYRTTYANTEAVCVRQDDAKVMDEPVKDRVSGTLHTVVARRKNK